jgi:hypothetical protein
VMEIFKCSLLLTPSFVCSSPKLPRLLLLVSSRADIAPDCSARCSARCQLLPIKCGMFYHLSDAAAVHAGDEPGCVSPDAHHTHRQHV